MTVAVLDCSLDEFDGLLTAIHHREPTRCTDPAGTIRSKSDREDDDEEDT